MHKKYKKLCENTEFAIYSILPLIFCILGAHTIAALVAFPVLLLVLVQELAEKNNKVGRKKPISNLPEMLIAAVSVIYILLTQNAFNLHITLAMYSFIYEIAYFDMKKIEEGNIKFNNGEKAVHGYFFICCALIMIMSIFI